jgi:diaminobutyrate acetyltransferase
VTALTADGREVHPGLDKRGGAVNVEEMPDLVEDSRNHRTDTPTVVIDRPEVEDGAAMWRMARDSAVLDLNASYAYLLWARDFAATSVVARVDGEPGGFVSGYRRPDEPDTMMVCQVAADEDHRGRGLARRMLDHLVERSRHTGAPFSRLETTITADNEASIALFSSFAAGHRATVERLPVFPAELFPDGHDAELLFRIGPLATG